MFERWHTYRTKEQLARSEYQLWRHLSDKEKRQRVTIGVIDDAAFAPKQNLENLGYNVKYLGDPIDISSVEDTQIVLCDLQGVGRSLDPKKQGAFFIREIRANYPEKYVIAYSGGGLNLSITRDAIGSADAFLKKDVTIEEWAEALDPFIDKILDPVSVWQRARIALVDSDISTLDLLKLEDAFVHSIKNRQTVGSSEIEKVTNRIAIDKSDVKSVISSMIASGIYGLLLG